MRITQGAFSFLPDLTDEEIRLSSSTASTTAGPSRSSTRTTRIPATRTGRCGASPCSTFRTRPASWASSRVPRRQSEHYIRVNAFDSTHGVESVALSFIATRPAVEPGFSLERTEGPGRDQRFTTISYAVDLRAHAKAERYGKRGI